MATSSQALILKVLSGSQFGVEVSLRDGEYTFGSGPDCDIQFTDISMAAHHGTLRIAGGKTELKAEGARLHTSSGLIIEAGEGEWREIAQLDQITAGTSVFSIGAADADWSKVAPVQSAPTGQPAAPVRSSSSMASIILGIAVIALCVAGIFFVTGGTSRLPLVNKTTPVEDLDRVLRAIKTLPFDTDLDVELQQDGVVSIAGYVKDSVQRRAVQNAVLDTGAPIRRRIWALEALQTDVSGLVESQAIDISYNLGGDGVLHLTGTHLDSKAVEQTVRLLETEVFGLAGVDNKILTSQDYLDRVVKLIDQVQLSDLVVARLDGELIETNGVVPVELTDNWAGFIRAYSRQYASIIPLRSYVTLEGQPRNTPTKPVLLTGDGLRDSATGRVIPTGVLSDEQNTDTSALFALPSTDTLTPPNGASSGTPTNRQPFEDIVNGLVSNNSLVVNGVIDSFVAENPDVVASLLKNLTNGQVDDVATLRAVFEQAAGEGDQAGTDASASENVTRSPGRGTPLTSKPEVAATVVRLINGKKTSLGRETAATTDEDTADKQDEAESSDQPDTGNNVDLSGFLPVPTFYEADIPLKRLNEATERLFDLSDLDNPRLRSSAMRLNPRLSEISQELVALAGSQTQALAKGETLLTSPGPLSAVPGYSPRGKTCWNGSNLTVESLPSVLLWMDILSVSGSVDVMGLEKGSRPIFIEAALNPDRLESCLNKIGSKFSTQLLRSSVFLRENALNVTFVEFLLRNVPRFDLEIVGTYLAETRYIHLADGRKLREGSAPDLASRLAVIGDSGLMVRVQDGYRVLLYDGVSWVVANAE